MNDDQTQDAVVPLQEAQNSETPTNDSTITPIENQNGGVKLPESEVPKPPIKPETSQSDQAQAEPNPELVQSVLSQSVSAPAPLTPAEPQPQSLAQQDHSVRAEKENHRSQTVKENK